MVVSEFEWLKSIIQDQTVGINLPEVLSTDFIALPTSTGIKGDDGVGITSDKKLAHQD
jgi:hypothetical protein